MRIQWLPAAPVVVIEIRHTCFRNHGELLVESLGVEEVAQRVCEACTSGMPGFLGGWLVVRARSRSLWTPSPRFIDLGTFDGVGVSVCGSSSDWEGVFERLDQSTVVRWVRGGLDRCALFEESLVRRTSVSLQGLVFS
jgi:hypothetical protein